MPLNNLNKDIYNSSSDLEKRTHEENTLDPMYQGAREDNPFLKEEVWEKEEKGLSQKQKKILGIGSGILVILLIIAGGLFYLSNARKNAFQQDRVSIGFDGPRESDSTQSVSYVIKYKNDNSVELEDVEISLNYSENFKPIGDENINLKQLNSSNSKIHIGSIKAKSEGEVKVTGVFYAPKDAPVYLRATLSYSPSNLSTKYETKNQIGVNITTSPILLEVSAPVESSSGDNITYVIDYKNLDVKSLGDAQLHVTYPEGFEFDFSDPTPSQNKNVWYFGVLDPGQGGKIIIQGKINSFAGSSSSIVVRIGRSGGNGDLVIYNERERATRIVESPFLLEQFLDGTSSLVASQGDVLRYIIKYKNKSDLVLRDVVLKLELDGVALDYAKMDTSKGYFDPSTKTITWKVSEIPAFSSLSPGAEGNVSVVVPVFKPIGVKGEADRNFIIKSISKISSSNYLDQGGQNKTIVSNAMEVRLNSDVSFVTSGFYFDSKIKNSGTMPMIVGKETDFTLHWSVSNDSSDLSGARIVSSLPSGVKWTGNIYPSGEKISYDERTNEVIWEIGNVSAGAGFYKSKKEVVFQVKVTPQPSDVDRVVKLLNNSVLTAKDSFTESEVRIENKEKTTQLEEDASLSYEYFKVKKTP